ncbi:MAG TPA: MBL fold metallo-hydrolase, partial [Pseudomonadales bacterium]|nr:MBL fold metallo-hydrolase [Pseudomonadales bacterium]
MAAPAELSIMEMEISPRPIEQLKLTNGGELELYFLGTGAAFAKTLNQNNLLLIKGEHHLAIDCGTKFSQALYDVGVPVSALRNFVITHSHADHIGGLEEIQLYGRYVSQIKPTMIINSDYEPILWEQSLRGGSERSETIPLKFEDLWNIIRPTPVEPAPRETWEANVGDINIKMVRTMHY